MLSTILATAVMAAPLNYPAAPTVDHVDDYNGVKVADPYRWLEQPIETPEVRAWVDAEAALTNDYLSQIPNRGALLAELEKRVNYGRYEVPQASKGVMMWEANNGLQNQNVLYSQVGSSASKTLLDPNKLSADNTVSVGATELSDDGRYVLYSLHKGGSDWCEWRLRNVATGTDKADVVKFSKFDGGSLSADGKGLYYMRFPEPKEGQALTESNINVKVCYHQWGSAQSSDKVLLEMPEHPDWFLSGTMDPMRNYLVYNIEAAGAQGNRLWVSKKGSSKMFRLVDNDLSSNSVVGSKGDWVYVSTTLGAPNGKVVAISAMHPSRRRTIIAQSSDTLQSVSAIGGQFVAVYMHNAHSVARVYSMEGKFVREIKTPGLGTTSAFSGRPEDRYGYYSYVDFFTPSTVYKYDSRTGASTIWKKPNCAVDSSKYTATQVFYKSKDGTRVPMYIVHKKGLKMNGQNPTILYGYGGFNIPELPWFSTSRSVWMDMGGVFCVANIRGGGEFGESWWKSATKTHRQRAYDDFIAASQYLISQKYTSKSFLAIQGGSNGGLLVGACMTQRPDLYKVAIPQVGVMDLLRFNQFTIGKAWEGDYGSPQNPTEFAAIVKISPYHNLKKGTHYPATLVTTADRDDRVVPAHSFKFAARLQACQGGDAPCLLRVTTSSGHGASNLVKGLEEVADIYAFTLHNMGRSIPEKF